MNTSDDTPVASVSGDVQVEKPKRGRRVVADPRTSLPPPDRTIKIPADTPIPQLHATQVPAYELHRARLSRWIGTIETGPLGSGKTYLMCALARELGLGLVYVGPKSVVRKAKIVAANFRVPVYAAVSYAGLRGSRKYPPKLFMLEKDGDKFVISAAGHEAIKRGVLVVFDEFHNLKNKSSYNYGKLEGLQIESAAAITAAIAAAWRNAGGRNAGGSNTSSTIIDNNSSGVEGLHSNFPASRVLLMSATPGDKIYHAYQFCRLLGITTECLPHRVDNSVIPPRVTPGGYADILAWCMERDPVNATRINRSRAFTAMTSWELTFELFTEIIMGEVATALPAPIKEYVPDLKNGFYRLHPADLARVRRGLDMMCGAVRNQDGVIKLTEAAMATLNIAIREIESGKVARMIALARADLLANPLCKVVLFFNFLGSIDRAMTELAEFAPLRFVGDIASDAAREKITAKFLAHDTEHRLFIATISAGGIGIDLDDKFGDMPRFTYISPSFMFINVVQSSGRTDRCDTKSRPTVRIVYASGPMGALEVRMFDAIVRKTDIAHKYIVTTGQPFPFPGDFPSIEE